MILTDGDCGFCQRSAAQIHRLGVRVHVTTLQAEDLASLGVDPDRALVEMALVESDGTVRYGASAWAGALRTGPVLWRGVAALMEAPGLRRLAALVYRWVAGNRYRLPGGTAACSLDAQRPPGSR